MRSSGWPLCVWLALAGALALLSCSGETVGPEGQVRSVSVSPDSAMVRVGETVTLQATVYGPDGQVLTTPKVFWNTENPAVVTVSEDGVVTGMGLGTARVAASAAGRSGFATITVRPPPVASVAVTPPSATIDLGRTITLHATTYDALGHELSGRPVSWSSDHANVAAVDQNGVVTGVGGGTATITATSEGKSGTATIEVELPPAASITITPALLVLYVGQSGQLTAVVRDASGKVIPGVPVEWSSSDERVATVSETGLVRGNAPGVADITARSGKARARIQVGVAEPVGGVSPPPDDGLY
jgi:uncharacterized protein YjdB